MSGYWYFIAYWRCPVCGHEETFRERRYDERPAEWEQRHEFVESYDWCLG